MVMVKMGKWMRGLRGALVAGLLISAVAGPASAAPSDAEAAAKKFTEAMGMMRSKRFAEACGLFEQSLELAPVLPTQFRLAECYEQMGRLASARRHYNEVAEAADQAGQTKQRDFARNRADGLATRVSKIVLMVAPEARATDGLSIKQDDVALPPKRWDQALDVDPGQVRITVSAPDHEDWSTEISILREAQLEAVEIPALTPLAPPPLPTEPEPVPPGESGGFMSLPTLGIVIGGVGVAALGTGIVLGVVAKSSYDDSLDHCSGDFCAQEGLDQQDDAVTLGTVGTVVFFVGTAAIVGGAALWFFAPDDDEAAADEFALRLGVTPGGALIRGSW
jgi:tetratricopeptide (TPR) repeat protein